MKRNLITIIILLVITGCVSTGTSERVKPSGELPSSTSGKLPPSTRPTYNLAGYPPSFKDGYIDGCETAKKSTYGFKDKQRFTKDNQYRNGWNDGYNLCLSK